MTQPTPIPIDAYFDALVKALAMEAVNAADDAAVDRALAFSAHIRTVRARWIAGEASPVAQDSAP